MSNYPMAVNGFTEAAAAFLRSIESSSTMRQTSFKLMILYYDQHPEVAIATFLFNKPASTQSPIAMTVPQPSPPSLNPSFLKA